MGIQTTAAPGAGLAHLWGTIVIRKIRLEQVIPYRLYRLDLRSDAFPPPSGRSARPLLRNHGGSKWKFYGANVDRLPVAFIDSQTVKRAAGKPIYSSNGNNSLTEKEFGDI
jgi:hypothetical protein